MAAEQTQEPQTLSVLLFQLGNELYAIPSANLREIARFRPYTPVPAAPPSLPGIISQRGAILPVVDARVLLGLEETSLTRSARLLIIQQGDIDMALLAETVLDLAELPMDALEPPPAVLDASRARLLSGVVQHAGEPIALLDLDMLIARLREEG